MGSADSLTRGPLTTDDIIVGGVRLRVHDWGGSGAPIVVLHATGTLAMVYRPIALALTAIGHVYSYDQRGHGDSDKSPALTYDWNATTADLEGFIRAMGLHAVRAFGHSAGATAIATVASKHPELISRAVLVEPVLFENPPRAEPLVERTIKRRRVFDSVAAMYANFENKPPFATWDRNVLRDYCEFGTAVNSDGKRELKCPPEIEARLYATSRDFEGLRWLLQCRQPLLILFALKGEEPFVAFADRIERALPQARVLRYAEAGHFMVMEMPQEVARLAVEFLGAGG